MSVLKGYLDTCLISAIVKSDLKDAEQLALVNIHEKYIAREIELFVSEHVEEELNKIPLNYRQQHLNMFEIFALVPKLIVGGLTRLGPIGVPTANPKRRTLNSLLSLLPDNDDAWHLLIASSNRITYFVTADESTVIKYKDKIKNICGVEVLLPSEFLAYCNHDNT